MSRGCTFLAAVILVLPLGSAGVSLRQGGGAGAGRSSNAPNAIVGRVLDPSGKPVPGTFVTALRPQARSATRLFGFVSALLRSTTNERGEFRLDGLSFEELYVVALPHNAPLGVDSRLNRLGYANTFYPNVTSAADAKTVRVTASGPATVEITLAPARLSAVSGTVIGAAGQPVRGGTVLLTHGDGLFGLDSRGFVIRPDGAFLAPALQPGTYFLQFHESAWPPPRGVIPNVSGVKVIVAGADVTNVRVVPITMVRVTGHLVVDPAARASLNPSMIRLGASPVDFDGNPGPQQPGDAKDDLTFEFRTWPSVGKVRVTIQLPRARG